MIRKLNVLTTLSAVVLFFLPWIELRCNGRALLTQTGFQTMTSDVTPSDELKQLTGGAMPDSQKPKESPKAAIWIWVAFGAALTASVLAWIALFSSGRTPLIGTGVCCAVAFSAICLQMAEGFPIQPQMKETANLATGERRGDPSAGYDPGLATVLTQTFETRRLPALYWELAALGLPVLVMGNELLDRLRAKAGHPA